MNTARSSVCFAAGLSLVLATLSTPTDAATVVLAPIKDNSIFSELGSNSNGGGGLFAGRTNPSGGIRRALVQFDILGNVPAGAVIDSVSISFVQTKIGPGATAAFELHRITKAWGEGTATGTGQGVAAGIGDATWNSSANSSVLWTTVGGDFASTSGTAVFGTTNTTYTFGTSTGLVADVQGWLNNPSNNFGWLLRAADENTVNARELGSRENPTNQRPSLIINYSIVPEPATASLFGSLLLLGCVRRRR